MISISARIVEFLMKAIDFKEARRKTPKPFVRDNKYSVPPKFMTKRFETKKFTAMDRNCFTLKSSDNPKTHIIFLHGGAYKSQAVIIHWTFLQKFLNAIPCKVTFIDYPLAPEQKCLEAVEMVTEAYKQLFDPKSNEKIILMGDSAGGGLALVLAQQIKKNNIQPKPTKLVLLSPWLDISMTSEFSDKLISDDLMLNLPILIEDGKSYAGTLDTKDALCSPIYGDFNDIGQVAVFTGTKDLLNIDARKLNEMAKKNNYNFKYYEHEGMQHVWAILPIKESKATVKQMIEFINA